MSADPYRMPEEMVQDRERKHGLGFYRKVTDSFLSSTPNSFWHLFSVSIVSLSPEFDRVGIIYYVAFLDGLLSPSNVRSNFLFGLIAHFFLALNKC